MKAPRMTKALSFLMALIFCIYLVPTEVLAAEVKGNALASASTYARDYDSVDSPDIVSEIVSSRDEYQKEYLHVQRSASVDGLSYCRPLCR